MKGFLQWDGPPFHTESVPVKHEYGDRYLALYGRWRRVHVQVKRLYVVIASSKVTIQLEDNPL